MKRNKEKSLKEIANNLMKIKGNVKGEVLRISAAYIAEKEGEKGVEVIEEKLKELGYSLKFKEIKPLRWYPEALSVLVILVAKDVFNWKNSDIFDMGNSAPKYSFIVKLLLKYLISVEKIFEECPKYWRKHFDFGELEPVEINTKEKYAIIRVKGYKFHPLICLYHAGYFLRLVQLSIRSKKITIKETKCMFKGDPYHQYLIKWR